jgi:plastocyanin
LTNRTRTLCIAAVAAAAALLPNAAWAQARQLNATVGPGFTISLSNPDGSRVTHLDPGTYDIVVNDRGIDHNFHLAGPGVNLFTGVEEVGTVTWTVNLVDGIYGYQCDPHASSMNGQFAVGTAQLPTPPPPPAPAPGVKKLTATVGPGFSISLTSGGKKVTRLKAGRYRITVRDRSHMHNFHLIGPGLNKKTAVAFHGTVTWTVALKKGKTYRYVCDPHKARMKGSFRVT